MTRDPSVFVHERALCESDEIGPRTRIWAFAHVMRGARVGADCNICGHVFIEAGARVGNGVTLKNNVSVWDKVVIDDDVFVGPSAVFTNDLIPRAKVKKPTEDFLPTFVKQGATIGANATIVCGVTIGPQAFVGAGAVVTKNVPAHALVVGTPAKPVGWICTCGWKLPESFLCRCGLSFRKVNDVEGLQLVGTVGPN